MLVLKTFETILVWNRFHLNKKKEKKQFKMSMVFIVLTSFRVFRLSGIYRRFCTVFQLFGKAVVYFKRTIEFWKFVNWYRVK